MPEKKDAELHTGHRQRMKERLLRNGLDSFAGHEALEVLLYYALPYRDTNELGHRLEEQFGGLNRVLDAAYADLLKVPGVTPHVATLITLCGQLAHRYMKEQYAVGRLLYTTQDYGNCALPWFVGEKVESVILISLDNRCRLLNTTRIFTGSVDSTQFNCRMAVQQALQDNATQVVLAHNHPSGHARFSRADVAVTVRFMQVLDALSIRLLDHLVVSEDDYVSMAESAETAALFRRDGPAGQVTAYPSARLADGREEPQP